MAGPASAQQVVVRSPNGLEQLKKGNTVAIRWDCVQCSGTVELYLVRVPTAPVSTSTLPSREGYQEVGLIKASIPVTPAQQSYSHNWRVGDYTGGTAPPAQGYKILVKVVTPAKTVSDLSDSGFLIGAAPTIDYFAINDGLAVTEQRRVMLNYRFSGAPLPRKYRVRCQSSQGTSDLLSPWLALPTTSFPVYVLPDKAGDYSLGLTLANDLGESATVTDMIRYEPAVPMKDYAINAATLVCGGLPDMDPAWYSCRCTFYSASITKPKPEDCSCTSTGAVVVRTAGAALGTKVEYEFFGGRELNPGWSFVSLSYSDIACRESAGSAVLVMPQPGSRNILFKIRLWTEGFAGLSLSEIAQVSRVCEFRINTIVIRGPADRPVSEAFK